MSDTRPALPAAMARLLRDLARFRGRNRAAQELGLPFLFRRRRKAALEKRLRQDRPDGFVLTEAGDLVFVPAQLDFQSLRLLFGGPEAHPAALKFVPPGGTALDVGANLGEWSLPLARAVGPQGRVLAFEPNPVIANALTQTLRINNLSQAEVVEIALSDRSGWAELLLNPANSGEARLGSPASETDRAQAAVPTRRLDDVAAEHGIARLDLVKIDVEGHERQVLEGAVATLDRFHPALVIESGHEGPGDREVIAGLLQRLDYELFAVLHDRGALPGDFARYRAASGAFAGAQARDLLLLPRRRAGRHD